MDGQPPSWAAPARLHALGPLRQSATDEWGASVRIRDQEFDTRAILPDTGEPFPDELWNVRFGTSYRHRFESGWIAGR